MNQDEPVKILIVGTDNGHSRHLVLMMASLLERYPNAIFIRESEDEYAKRIQTANKTIVIGFDECGPVPDWFFGRSERTGKGERKRNKADRWR